MTPITKTDKVVKRVDVDCAVGNSKLHRFINGRCFKCSMKEKRYAALSKDVIGDQSPHSN